MKDDSAFNKMFVQLVQKKKCLYNTTCPEYRDRDVQDAAWQSVAIEVNASVDECRARWKNLRGALTRYLKHRSGGQSKAVKKYYLSEAMQFLIPFTKTRRNYGVQKFETNSPSHAHQDESDNEMEELPFEYQIEDTKPHSEETSRSYNDDCPEESSKPPEFQTPKGKMCVTDPLDMEMAVATYFSKRATDTVSADLDFFKSILPDIAYFNPSQKRRFKQRVLQIIEDISSEDVSGPSSVPSGYHFINSNSADQYSTGSYDPLNRD